MPNVVFIGGNADGVHVQMPFSQVMDFKNYQGTYYRYAGHTGDGKGYRYIEYKTYLRIKERQESLYPYLMTEWWEGDVDAEGEVR